MPGDFSVSIFSKGIEIIVNVIFCLEISNPQGFLTLLLFFTSFYLFVLTEFVLIKMYNFLGNYSGSWSFYKQLQLLTVEVPKWPKSKEMLSTKCCSVSDYS